MSCDIVAVADAAKENNDTASAITCSHICGPVARPSLPMLGESVVGVGNRKDRGGRRRNSGGSEGGVEK